LVAAEVAVSSMEQYSIAKSAAVITVPRHCQSNDLYPWRPATIFIVQAHYRFVRDQGVLRSGLRRKARVRG